MSLFILVVWIFDVSLVSIIFFDIKFISLREFLRKEPIFDGSARILFALEAAEYTVEKFLDIRSPKKENALIRVSISVKISINLTSIGISRKTLTA